MSDHTSFGLRPIKDLQNMVFHVEKYQRGYKWDVQQVLDLLSDIEEFDADAGGLYCLQPVVVKKHPEGGWELIDGQQRLTTFYIALQTLGHQLPYEIKYKTRKESEKFLPEVCKLSPWIGRFDLRSETEGFEEELNKYWVNDYAVAHPEADNIDNFHFFKAFQTIVNWRGDKTEKALGLFVNKVLHQTAVIWYEDLGGSVPEKVFSNLNSGKIALTGAELIKALFILQIQKAEINLEIRELKQTELAREWDRIECRLQESSFWYFICGEEAETYSTRIDFVFDLIWEKPAKADSLFSYRKYAKLAENSDAALPWDQVQRLFQTLEEWYHDREMYHLIGYLVSIGFAGISKLLKDYGEASGKSDFRKKLRSIIRGKFSSERDKDGKKVRPYALSELNYEEGRGHVNEVLLLFNLETMQKNDLSFRFPFDRFHQQDWSVEHIHPQNPQGIATVQEAVDWLEEQQKRLGENESTYAGESAKVKGLIEDLKTKRELTDQLQERLSVVAGSLTGSLDLHGVSNLALLDKLTNSAIGNKRFLEKRSLVMEKELDGKFIPICTKNAFLKYYSRNVSKIQMTHWSQSDANDYFEAISKTLKRYYKSDQDENGN